MSASSTSFSRHLPKLAKTGALALLACGTMACGIEPGDYIVYRVAATSTTVSPSCYYPDSTPPPDEAEDVNTILQSLTLTIHIGSDGNAYLTAGGLVLPGENSASDWTFIGEDIDFEYIGMNDDARLVTTTLTTGREARPVKSGSTPWYSGRAFWLWTRKGSAPIPVNRLSVNFAATKPSWMRTLQTATSRGPCLVSKSSSRASRSVCL